MGTSTISKKIKLNINFEIKWSIRNVLIGLIGLFFILWVLKLLNLAAQTLLTIESNFWFKKSPLAFYNLINAIRLIIFNGYLIILLWYFVKRKYKSNINSLGFVTSNIIKNLLWGSFVGFVTFFMLRLGYSLISESNIFSPQFEIKKMFDIVIITAFLTISCEETFYRGFCYPAFRNRVGWLFGNLITSSIFVLAHYFRVDFFSQWLLIIPIGFVSSVSFGILYEKTRSIFAPIMAHLIFNYLGYFL